jgi:hypothetical protein
VEPKQLDAEVEKLVATIIANPRVAVAMGKEFFYGKLDWTLHEPMKRLRRPWPAT